VRLRQSYLPQQVADVAVRERVDAWVARLDGDLRYRERRFYNEAEPAARRAYIDRAMAFASVRQSSIHLLD
jgi:chromatin segregation and condensation protein Rec8/ScpA/Scc1 (kleisin family)